MRLALVVAVTLCALVGVGTLPIPAGAPDGNPCTTIEHDGHIHVYPENCVPDGNGGYYIP